MLFAPHPSTSLRTKRQGSSRLSILEHVLGNTCFLNDDSPAYGEGRNHEILSGRFLNSVHAICSTPFSISAHEASGFFHLLVDARLSILELGGKEPGNSLWSLPEFCSCYLLHTIQHLCARSVRVLPSDGRRQAFHSGICS